MNHQIVAENILFEGNSPHMTVILYKLNDPPGPQTRPCIYGGYWHPHPVSHSGPVLFGLRWTNESNPERMDSICMGHLVDAIKRVDDLSKPRIKEAISNIDPSELLEE